MAMLNNQRVSWDIEKLRQVVNPMVDQASGKSQCLDPCYAGDECVWSPSTEKVWPLWDSEYMLILVGGFSPTPLENMSSSVGMMTFPIYGKI